MFSPIYLSARSLALMPYDVTSCPSFSTEITTVEFAVFGRQYFRIVGVENWRMNKTNKTNSVALSPQANYTDRATIATGEVSADLCG
jgi:hypothetical protein